MNENHVVEKILAYIDAHLEDDLSLEQMAKDLHYSKFYLSKAFTKANACTLYKYIQKRRLTLAAQQLVTTEKAIIEIAYEAHYQSQQAFTLAFGQLYLCTPQTYRKKGTCIRAFSYTTYNLGGRMVA